MGKVLCCVDHLYRFNDYLACALSNKRQVILLLDMKHELVRVLVKADREAFNSSKLHLLLDFLHLAPLPEDQQTLLYENQSLELRHPYLMYRSIGNASRKTSSLIRVCISSEHCLMMSLCTCIVVIVKFPFLTSSTLAPSVRPLFLHKKYFFT